MSNECMACKIEKCFTHGNITKATYADLQLFTINQQKENIESFKALLTTPNHSHCHDCRRFEAAKAAMGGIVAGDKMLEVLGKNNVGVSMDAVITSCAVELGDALLAELEKKDD